VCSDELTTTKSDVATKDTKTEELNSTIAQVAVIVKLPAFLSHQMCELLDIMRKHSIYFHCYTVFYLLAV